jgi:hypothetical protein
MERFPFLTGVIGIRRSSSYPRFKNWEFFNSSNGFDAEFFDNTSVCVCIYIPMRLAEF